MLPSELYLTFMCYNGYNLNYGNFHFKRLNVVL